MSIPNNCSSTGLGDPALLHHLARSDDEAGEIWRLDPNGTVPLYRVNDSSSLSPCALDLARQSNLEPQPEHCASFLINGVYYDGAAFHSHIRVLPPGITARVSENKLSVNTVDLLTPWQENGAATTGPRELAEALVKAVEPLRGLRVVCDLTGGFDARLVALTLVAAGIPFTGSVTGDENSPDVVIARQLADHLGVDLIHDRTEAPDDLDLWRQCLLESGGTLGVRQAARLLAIQGGRARHFDVSVGGLGGELLRDFWWLQEPTGLASNMDPDWHRLVRYRIYQSGFPVELLNQQWAESVRKQPTRCAQWLADEVRQHPLPRKRDRLDFAYLRLHIPRWVGAGMTASLQRIKLHHPILDPSVLQIAFSARSGQRRLTDLVRRTISLLDADAARLPIESGGTALPLGPMTPWRYLPVARRLTSSVLRRVRRGRKPMLTPAWGDRPLELDLMIRRGILEKSAIQDYRYRPGSLVPLERLQTLELIFQLLEN
jgi:hypothetical protein